MTPGCRWPLLATLMLVSGLPLAEPVVEAETPPASAGGVVSERIEAASKAADNPFALLTYEPNYLIYSYVSQINREPYQRAGESYADELDYHEVKFQISLAVPLWRGIAGDRSALMGSYTQLSLWQQANKSVSAPFRETNYEPQLFVSWLPEYELWGWRLALFDLGYNHQSNGSSEPLSRSWNRLYANAVVERGNWAVQFKPWYRLPEDAEDDDNPDLEDYVGHALLRVAYRGGDHVWSGRGRFNPGTGKGGLELGWSYPLSDRFRIYAQLYQGYGESLVDYNHEQTRIGIGLMLNDVIQ